MDGNNRVYSGEQKREIMDPFRISGHYGQIRKLSGIWFRFLDKDIQSAVLGKLREIAAIVRTNNNVTVTIQGHAWMEGTNAENLRLSQDRADSVLRFLIENQGVSPRNVSAIGYGETMPISRGRTQEAADINRRVEVVIISNVQNK